jgi:uncharacterized protein
MLYRLELENFYSIRDSQSLDLRVPKSVTDFPERYAELFPGSEERVAKTICVFGANGSGKSTVLKALAFISWFLKDSFENKGHFIPYERFNDRESADRLTTFALEFGGQFDFLSRPISETNRGTLRYELSLRTIQGVKSVVEHEALRIRSNQGGKWQRVFERRVDRSVVGSKYFSLSGFAQVTDKVRENSSVISTLSLFEHLQSKAISEAAGKVFKNIFIERAEIGDHDAISYLASNPAALESINRELQRIDIGVKEMKILSTDRGPEASFAHTGLDQGMPLTLESHGTRSFVRLYPYLLLALETGGIAVVDELDQAIHPLILPEILRWFHDPVRNKYDAQLWASCHAASLLDDLTKEEIVFCEKDQFGRSRIYSLMDVGAVRRSDNLYKKYLSGVYGAVPQIG